MDCNGINTLFKNNTEAVPSGDVNLSYFLHDELCNLKFSLCNASRCARGHARLVGGVNSR